MFITLIYTIYQFIISYYRIKHIIAILKSDKLDIRNSPLDRLARLSARALLCFKGACDTAQPVGLTLGLMLGTDEVLKNANRDPIFGPILGSILNSVLPENVSKDSTKLINKSINEISSNNQDLAENKSLLEKFQNLHLKGDISLEEFKEMQKIILENQEAILAKNAQLKSKILEELENLKKK